MWGCSLRHKNMLRFVTLRPAMKGCLVFEDWDKNTLVEYISEIRVCFWHYEGMSLMSLKSRPSCHDTAMIKLTVEQGWPKVTPNLQNILSLARSGPNNIVKWLKGKQQKTEGGMNRWLETCYIQNVLNTKRGWSTWRWTTAGCGDLDFFLFSRPPQVNRTECARWAALRMWDIGMDNTRQMVVYNIHLIFSTSQ